MESPSPATTTPAATNGTNWLERLEESVGAKGTAAAAATATTTTAAAAAATAATRG